jgi:hypothetical protein
LPEGVRMFLTFNGNEYNQSFASEKFAIPFFAANLRAEIYLFSLIEKFVGVKKGRNWFY